MINNIIDIPEDDLEEYENHILALLLINNVIFINNHWWKDSWSEECKALTSLNVNCNDVFAWGCADAETINFEDILEVYNHYKKDPIWGPSVFCLKKRNMLPQKPVYDIIQKEKIWDLDTMNLDPNPTWK